MKYINTLIFTYFFVTALNAQSSIPALNGWNQKEQDGHVVFTPKTLFNTGFSYEVMPLLPTPGESLGDWLEKKGRSDLTVAGYAAPAAGEAKRQLVQSYETWSAIAVKNGKRWSLHFIAFQKPDNTIRYAMITTPTGPKSPYMDVAIKHFIQLSVSDGMMKQIAGDKPVNENNQSVRTEKIVTPLTTPGNGLKASDIKGVVMNMEYGTGVGGMLIIEYRAYLLLNDGSLYKYPDCPPYDLDVAKSREIQPDKWGTWKMEGNTIVVNLPEKGGTKTSRWEKNWFWGQPAKDEEKVNGSFKTISGGGNTALGGGAMIVSAANLTLNDKGQFTYAHTGGGSNSDSNGDVAAYSSQNSAGTYTLKGYSIELKFNNGKVLRKFFYFYPKTRDTFTINEDAYVPAGK